MGRDTDFDYGANVCDALVVCTKCGTCHGPCYEVRNFTTYEGGQMINRDGQRTQPQQTGLPNLTAEQIEGATTQVGKIVAARVEPDSKKPGAQIVVVRVQYNGKDWIVYLRSNNPNLDKLCDGFGNEESLWAGKPIHVFAEEDKITSKRWLRLEPYIQSGAETGQAKLVAKR